MYSVSPLCDTFAARKFGLARVFVDLGQLYLLRDQLCLFVRALSIC